jgi:hypothetical protein
MALKLNTKVCTAVNPIVLEGTARGIVAGTVRVSTQTPSTASG